jgi:hypothetical protein
MAEQSFNKLALIATVLICFMIDGALFAFCVLMAEGLGQGALGFLAFGGPTTVIVAPQMYSWFKKRFSEHSTS